MIKTISMYGASLLAITVALYHGVVGDEMMQALPLETADTMFVRATFHIGTMGWLMGGILLFGAARITSQRGRNWIVGALLPLYGFPAIGNFMLNGGRPSFGWIALVCVVVLALFGRKINNLNRLTEVSS